ncbi:hypothetical protein L0244_12270 [bacterium]|nr:hypothetical protein [bacterium]
MRKRKYFYFGFFGPIAILTVASILIILQIAFRYNGKCGGFLPWLAGPMPCSFWEYVSGNSIATFTVVWIAYWPFLLALIAVPPLVGLVLDVQAEHKSQKVG